MQEDYCLKAALQYVRRGWSVIPIHSMQGGQCSCGNPECASPGKHPRVRWTEFMKARATEAMVQEWWRKWPDANVGIVTGPISEIAVIDIDGPEGEESIKSQDVPITLTCLTGGGGRHLYYRYPRGGSVQTKTGILRKVDTRGEGGFVVAPPSRHHSGKCYAWLDSGTRMADFPLAVVAKSDEVHVKVDTSLGPIPDGQRNDTLTRIAGSMLGAGHTLDHVVQHLLLINRVRCHPPLDDGEVLRVVESIASMEMRKKDISYINRKLEMPVPIETILKYGRVDSTWVLMLEDKTPIPLGPTANVYQLAAVRTAIADSIRHTIRIQSKAWVDVAAKIIELAIEVDDEERADDMTQWILQYVRNEDNPPRVDMSTPEGRHDAVEHLCGEAGSICVIDTSEDRLYVVLDNKYISHTSAYVSLGIKSVVDAAKRLQTILGFEKIRLSGGWKDGRCNRVVCRVSPAGFVEEMNL